MQTLISQLPEHAKDLRLNLAGVTKIESLSDDQLWGPVLASAYASGNAAVLTALHAEALLHLTPEVVTAAKTAASVMAMNNVYYRFVHLASNPIYGTLPARLRMQGLRTHGIEQATFELWALAVSAINGCGMCIDSHEQVLAGEGVRPEAIQDAIRVAAIVQAVATVLTAEDALIDSIHVA